MGIGKKKKQLITTKSSILTKEGVKTYGLMGKGTALSCSLTPV